MEYPKFRYKPLNYSGTCRVLLPDDTVVGIIRHVFNRLTRENYWQGETHDGVILPVKFYTRTLTARALWADHQQS